MRLFRLFALRVWLALSTCFMLLGTRCAIAQNRESVKSFAGSESQVRQALQILAPSQDAELPMLEGFVTLDAQQLNRCSRARYRLVVSVDPGADGTSIVRTLARISAWCSGGDPAHSSYESLTSNGRLEADLLARLEEYLGAHPAGSTEICALQNQLVDLRNDRKALDRQRRNLEEEINQLQSVQQRIGRPQLLFITHEGAKVVSRPGPTTHELMTVKIEDEFSILDEIPGWFRIELEAGQSGWLRHKDARRETEEVASESSSPPAPEKPFVIARELVSPFSGEWKALQGKNALFIFAKENGAPPQEAPSRIRLQYALDTFAQRYEKRSSAAPTFEGIVVVFQDGIAAATIPDIRRWIHGGLSKDLFLKRCSLDPLMAFNSLAKNP